LIAALKDVGVEDKQEPDCAIILLPQMEEKLVQGRQQNTKSATHKIAQVCFAIILSSNFCLGAKLKVQCYKLDVQECNTQGCPIL
jgi:hypothetical protein